MQKRCSYSWYRLLHPRCPQCNVQCSVFMWRPQCRVDTLHPATARSRLQSGYSNCPKCDCVAVSRVTRPGIAQLLQNVTCNIVKMSFRNNSPSARNNLDIVYNLIKVFSCLAFCSQYLLAIIYCLPNIQCSVRNNHLCVVASLGIWIARNECDYIY